jgi:hypothetical protein
MQTHAMSGQAASCCSSQHDGAGDVIPFPLVRRNPQAEGVRVRLAQAVGAAMDTGALPYCAIIMRRLVLVESGFGFVFGVGLWNFFTDRSLSDGIASATFQAPTRHIAGRLEHIMA